MLPDDQDAFGYGIFGYLHGKPHREIVERPGQLPAGSMAKVGYILPS